ncbi:hypothetical protein M422DRAFT_229444 [Sphaerobolus stellatus SS14]|uniref:Polyketide synthase phosphopantetheine-binding domain-containing protein n=1 Tax=Sphaerobolus stellatus (strain SS14) TaxID=990650 RepID=A0A0C9VK11_SPHS4|nr:hypothetical protein M422DRAFT_229444 [Sphaerobolus stellatus SS14]
MDRSLPSHPQTQALSSNTFRPPPLDGSLTLPELYEWHLEHSSEHRLFVFADDEGDVRTIKWPEAVHAVHVGAKLVRKRLGNEPHSANPPIVVILAPSDTITYFVLLMAIMRANYIAFPISPRNSAAAVAHLVSKTGVKHILLGQEQSMQDLANEMTEILKTQYPSVALPQISPIPLFQDLFDQPVINMDDLPIERKSPDDIVIYLHSSGSTAFPKPIPWTNHRFAQLALIPYFGERDQTDLVWSIHTIPMFHGMGILQLCWTASTGTVMAAFEPKSPAVVPTADGLFKAAAATNSGLIFCVPAIIEAWSRNPIYVKWLATRTGVLFGGGPLNKMAGDSMTAQGVNIFILYGSTEGGIVSPVLPGEVGFDWDYFTFPENISPEMIPHGNNTFELVMLTNPFCKPSVINIKIRGIEAYATSDLFTPHPTKPGYWRVYGRTDDQIMHNTGEKTNPGPLENMLNQDPHVISSVMFGRGYFQAGIIVDPKPEFKFNPDDELKVAAFRNKIWPTVQKMNAFAPQQSRLFKEVSQTSISQFHMIMVVNPSKPFQYTAKNTARRQVIINDYNEEIEALYASVEASTQANIPPPEEWNIVSTTDFVRTIVNKVLVHKVKDNDDIFNHGCDSLQATWIRNSLLRALRDSARIDTREAVENFVYDHPSINALSLYMVSVASGVVTTGTQSEKMDKVSAMQAIVTKYTADLPASNSISAGPESAAAQSGHIVLVTGTTGALGCYLLAELASRANITRIYALNRPSKQDESLLERQRKALVDRGLDATTVLTSPKIYLLEADVTMPGFGIPSHIYNEVHASVTHIIHNSWTVDFNLALSSFEPSIRGLRYLVDFALTSPLPILPKLIYTSSIGVFQNVPEQGKGNPLPEDAVAADVAVGTGYTESKWVSEQILGKVWETTPLKPLTVRVGQLCGGPNGAWNTREWLPSLVHSATVVKCLPTEDKDVTWIPLNIAANGLVDFIDAELEATRVVHLIHPRPVPWARLAEILSTKLEIPLVPFSTWIEELEILSNSMKNSIAPPDRNVDPSVELLRQIPALRILSFLKNMSQLVEISGDAFGFPKLAVSNAINLSATLSNPGLQQLGEKDVGLWLNYWRRARLLKDKV